jgi:hypothetical protein
MVVTKFETRYQSVPKSTSGFGGPTELKQNFKREMWLKNVCCGSRQA